MDPTDLHYHLEETQLHISPLKSAWFRLVMSQSGPFSSFTENQVWTGVINLFGKKNWCEEIISQNWWHLLCGGTIFQQAFAVQSLQNTPGYFCFWPHALQFIPFALLFEFQQGTINMPWFQWVGLTIFGEILAEIT